MKKIFLPCIVLITGMLLSSCSNSSKMSIAKRHYRGGYYVSFGHKAPVSTVASTTSSPGKVESKIMPVVTAKPEVYNAINVPVAAVDKLGFVERIQILKKTKENIILSTSPSSTYQNSTTLNTQTNNDVIGSSGDDRRENVSIPFVVIVLCAIFIPPLGVGLMYGINSYFWIDLILTLLFFFPGMIFAIIVVLM